MSGHEPGGIRGVVRQVLALERDVLVLSVAMFAFSLGFQMTGSLRFTNHTAHGSLRSPFALKVALPAVALP